MNSMKIREGFLGQQMIILPPDTQKMVIKNPLISGSHLTAIGYYPKAIYHYRERKAGSPQYILLYCTEGKGHVEIAKRRYELIPNTYIIIPKNTTHHYYSLESDPWSIYWVHFSGKHADILFSRYSETDLPEVKSIAYDEQRIEQFNLMLSLLQSAYDKRAIELTNIKLLQFFVFFHLPSGNVSLSVYYGSNQSVYKIYERKHDGLFHDRATGGTG